MNALELAQRIDHTLLKSKISNRDINERDIRTLCAEAAEHNFRAVCIPPGWVSVAADCLRGTSVVVCTVVGFPLGILPTVLKVIETKRALRDGATEIDMVMDIHSLLDGNYNGVLQDIQLVRQSMGDKGLLKVIIETCRLSDDQKQVGARLAAAGGAEFVKTSTGTIPNGGATVDDVRLLRKSLDDLSMSHIKIKASGGIGNFQTALAMLEAGADRLGTSHGIKILGESPYAPLLSAQDRTRGLIKGYGR